MRIGVATLLLLVCGCKGELSAAEYGEQLYKDPLLSTNDDNVYSCSTCHDIEGSAEPGKAGLPLGEAAGRQRYFGGQVLTLLEATNFCLDAFMRGAPLAEAEPRSRALYAFLRTHSSHEDDSPRPVTFVTTLSDVLPNGDKQRGRAVYEASCENCHGELESGDARIDSTAPILPRTIRNYANVLKDLEPRQVVVEKIRHGRFYGLGGTMPPFARERLSDEDLSALLSVLLD